MIVLFEVTNLKLYLVVVYMWTDAREYRLHVR